MKNTDKTYLRKASAIHKHEEGVPALNAQNLSVHYNGRLALEDVSIQVDAGLTVAVVGPNGAGKSTLFHVLAGVLQPTNGSVQVYGHRPTRFLCTAYVTQSNQVDWTFPVCVADVVMMGRTGALGLFRRPRTQDRLVVEENLARAGISHLANRQINELSSGQKQRMFIARALAQNADLLLFDEPLAGLDVSSQEQVFDILDDLKESGKTVFFATHDLDLARERFDRILLLNRRLIAFGEDREVLSADKLSAAFGGHLQMVDTEDGLAIIGDMGGHHDHEQEGPHG